MKSMRVRGLVEGGVGCLRLPTAVGLSETKYHQTRGKRVDVMRQYYQ